MFIKHRVVAILVFVFLVSALSGQARSENRGVERYAPTVHNNQPVQRPQLAHPTPAVHIESPMTRTHPSRSDQRVPHQQVIPRVYAVRENQPVVNNRLFHRKHHGNWHPAYNFYDNEYHFYPYVTVASLVTLSPDCIAVLYNGITYYYDQGSFYEDEGSAQGYVAVPPPIGIVVPTIYVAIHQHIINGVLYYSHNGVYYKPVRGGYQVVGVVKG